MASNFRLGSVRGVLSTGTVRPDGLVPVGVAMTTATGTWLTRTLYVPQEDVQRFVPRAIFAWLLTSDGEGQVAAVGRTDVEAMLTLAGAS